jgi:hypothetical protein
VAASPDQIASKWSSRLAQSGDQIKSGVQGVNVAPGQLAARQRNVWQQNLIAAADKWASRVAAVSLAEWQQDMLNKGVPRIASGAQAAQPKFAQFMGQLLPYIESGRANLPPRGDLEANINRLTSFVRYMSQFRRR